MHSRTKAHKMVIWRKFALYKYWSFTNALGGSASNNLIICITVSQQSSPQMSQAQRHSDTTRLTRPAAQKLIGASAAAARTAEVKTRDWPAGTAKPEIYCRFCTRHSCQLPWLKITTQFLEWLRRYTSTERYEIMQYTDFNYERCQSTQQQLQIYCL